MSVLERSLAKLTIRAYHDREMKRRAGSVEAMYNPDTLSLNYRTKYDTNSFINDDRQSSSYVGSSPGGLNLELIFDARMPGNERPLQTQLEELQALCYGVDPASSEPHFLSVSWGRMSVGGAEGRDFTGRATDFSISYSLFDRNGTPLRASVSLAMIADSSLILQRARMELKSPPVALISVTDVSSLPSLSAQSQSILKGGIDYLTLADCNDLDSLNAIEPGQTLMAPAPGGHL